MSKDIELEEPETPKRGRPKKLTEDIVFGADIDNDEEKRLREEQEITRMLEREDATNTTIIVSRRTNRTQRYAHLSEIGISDYEREEIARQYGGGEYRCRLRRSDGHFGATWYFQVDPSRKAETLPDALGTAGGIDAVRLVETVASRLAPKEDSGKQNDMIQMMMSKSDDLFKMMMVMQQENTKLLMTALSSRPPETNNSALQQMSTMLLQHSLQSSKTSMDDMLGTIVKLKKLSEDSSGRDEEPQESGSFVKDIMSAIPQVLKSFTGGQAQQAQQLPIAPPQASAVPAPVEPRVSNLPANIEPQGFTMVLMNLLQFALAGSEPVDVHNSYQPMLTDEMYEQIASFLENTPTWFEEICVLVPDAKPHRAWFEELRAVILEDDEAEVEDTTPEPEPVEAEATEPVKAKAKKAKG